MDDPEKILSKIMDFERTCTPRFTDLIKQSLIAHVDIDDDMPDTNINTTNNNTNDEHIQDRHSFQSPLTSYNNNDNDNDNNDTPNIEKHAISLSQPSPNDMPSYKKHKHKVTPIMSRNKPNSNIKIIDTNSFIITDDLQYNSDEDNDDEDNDMDTYNINYHRTNKQDDDEDDEEDEFEDDKPSHPLIEEYDSISHQIHKSKLKLRKLDRQITIAQRQNESQSVYVKQHSDIKITIAQLITKRRELETHDVVKAYVKEEEGEAVDIDTGGNDIDDILDASNLMGINEDEEEEDEIKNNAISPINGSSSNDHTSDSDGNVDDDTLQGYIHTMNGDDTSRTTSSTINDITDYDYSYDTYDHVIVNEEYEQEPLSGSVKFHSDDEHESNGSGSGTGSGGGSVEYHSDSDPDSQNASNGSMEIHGSDSNRDDFEDESDQSNGSVQLNDEIENNENWVDDDFDSKDMQFNHENDENDEHNENDDQNNNNDNNNNDTLDNNIEASQPSARSKRLEQMREHKHYSAYGTDEHHGSGDLDELKNKYRNSRRNREQISEIETPFSFDDLIKGIDDVDVNGDNKQDMDDDVNDITASLMQYKFDADDDNMEYPSIPNKRQSILLDINQFSAKLANIVEEVDEDDEHEKYFQNVEYETDSDCDSNDSVVIKKEVVKNVAVDEINDLKN